MYSNAYCKYAVVLITQYIFFFFYLRRIDSSAVSFGIIKKYR